MRVVCLQLSCTMVLGLLLSSLPVFSATIRPPLNPRPDEVGDLMIAHASQFQFFFLFHASRRLTRVRQVDRGVMFE